MNGFLGRLSHADERLLCGLVVRRRPALDAIMKLVTKLGDVTLVVPIALALALGAVPSMQATGAVALWCLASSHLVVQLIKRRVCRRRPSLPVGLTFLVEPEDRFSFPSGHSAAGLSVALPLALAAGGAWGVVILAVGLGVGVSRCYLGVHYPGDVLVGWCLASVSFVVAPFIGGVVL
jgi:undecaprenyl-diphosphatase